MPNFKAYISNLMLKVSKKLLFKNYTLGVWVALLYQKISNGKYKVLALDNFENIPTRFILEPAKKITCSFPLSLNLEREDIEKEQKSLGFSVLINGVFSTETSTVLYKDKLYIQNYSSITNVNNLDLVSGLLVANSSQYGLINIPSHQNHIEEGISFCGNWYKNWFHWSIEILSKYALYVKLPEHYKSFPILVPSYIATSPNHLSILLLLFKKEKILFIEDNTWQKVNTLIHIETPALDTPNLKFEKKASIYDSDFNFEILKEYRKKLTEKLQINSDAPKRIFLSRTQSNRKYNQEEVFALFEKYGFISVFCEKLNFKEQQELFYNAEFIAGPTGASWTNIIFSNNNSKGIIWLPDAVNELVSFSNLANLSGMKLYHHYYETPAANWSSYNNSTSEVALNIASLKTLLKKTIDSSF